MTVNVKRRSGHYEKIRQPETSLSDIKVRMIKNHMKNLGTASRRTSPGTKRAATIKS